MLEGPLTRIFLPAGVSEAYDLGCELLRPVLDRLDRGVAITLSPVLPFAV